MCVCAGIPIVIESLLESDIVSDIESSSEAVFCSLVKLCVMMRAGTALLMSN